MSASSEKNNKPGASGREPTLHLHTVFHSTLNDPSSNRQSESKREWMFSRRQIASLIRMCWSRNEPHNPVVILRGNSPKWSAVDTGWNISDGPGETIRSTTLHPLTSPYEIGRELARSRYPVQVNFFASDIFQITVTRFTRHVARCVVRNLAFH